MLPPVSDSPVNASAIPNSVEPFPILESIVSLPNVSFNSGGDAGDRDGRRRRRRRG